MRGRKTSLPVAADEVEVLEVQEEPGDVLGRAVWLPSPLVEFLVAPSPEEAARRLRPTLTVWFDGQRWRGSLHSKARSMVAFLSADDLPELIRAMARNLQNETLGWRSDRSRSEGG